MTNPSRTLILSLAIASILVISAFRTNPANNRIKTETMTMRGATSLDEFSVFTYDSSGRLVSTIYNSDILSGHAPDTIHRMYTSDTILRATNSSPFAFEYKLNADGRAIQDESGNVYYYDSAGFCVKVSYPDGITASYTISNGDIVRYYYITDDSSKYSLRTYTFYQEIDHRDFGKAPEGRRNTHMIKSYFSHQFNDVDHTINYSYEYDTLGRVISQIQKGRTSSIIRKYTYYD